MPGALPPEGGLRPHSRGMKEALLYEKAAGGKVVCGLCAHRCRIGPGKRGICGVRENRDGRLMTLVYGKAISQAVDPIEKKPLYHFLPGSSSFSVATAGCNFRCRFCQNSQISQGPREGIALLGEGIALPGEGGAVGGFDLPPERLVEEAELSGALSISYTYTEPTVFFEYALDSARLASRHGMKNVFVTNGYMTAEALEMLHPDLHGANVDLKSFRDEFYRKEAGARLEPVLESLRVMKRQGVWVEVTTLLIPGLNDSQAELRDIARFIRDDLGPEVPWHVSRFFPHYRAMDIPATPLGTVRGAREIGLEEGLYYVYTGNVPGDGGEATSCSRCAAVLVERQGLVVTANRVSGGRCPECGSTVHGVFG